MLAEIERINLITSELLFLSKPQAVKFEPVDVRQILKDTYLLFEPQFYLLGIKTEFYNGESRGVITEITFPIV
ncbi:hypothetical protein BKP35_06640 [Anaerobacillus arseniciselenatis]|uniref:Uncharacterized protein n=1 Tax=Anaerobacillus arseniciselenatis TaxID=85682 RepID=A0A1S2LPU8_9BACI|nr:hypothetical protein [Anaerobacillus arseniciselenatis]OIJ14549.1 hypothetical protein BKP35_06640 [Anaerobacillus arseniciselenatis]